MGKKLLHFEDHFQGHIIWACGIQLYNFRH